MNRICEKLFFKLRDGPARLAFVHGTFEAAGCEVFCEAQLLTYKIGRISVHVYSFISVFFIKFYYVTSHMIEQDIFAGLSHRSPQRNVYIAVRSVKKIAVSLIVCDFLSAKLAKLSVILKKETKGIIVQILLFSHFSFLPLFIMSFSSCILKRLPMMAAPASLPSAQYCFSKNSP